MSLRRSSVSASRWIDWAEAGTAPDAAIRFAENGFPTDAQRTEAMQVTVMTAAVQSMPVTFEYVGQTAGSREVEVRAGRGQVDALTTPIAPLGRARSAAESRLIRT